MIHRTTPHNKELYPTQNVTIAEVEKPELGFSVFVFEAPEACEDLSSGKSGIEPGPQQ